VEQAGLRESFTIDSAGTGSWHVGEPADRRSAAEARGRGIELVSRARRFGGGDFDDFDLVIAMDRSNRDNLVGMARGPGDLDKIHLLRDFDPASSPGSEVPDPYYGGDDGFARVFDICEAGAQGLLDRLRRDHGL
jgi:protein-tyrosine phosphatase